MTAPRGTNKILGKRRRTDKWRSGRAHRRAPDLEAVEGRRPSLALFGAGYPAARLGWPWPERCHPRSAGGAGNPQPDPISDRHRLHGPAVVLPSGLSLIRRRPLFDRSAFQDGSAGVRKKLEDLRNWPDRTDKTTSVGFVGAIPGTVENIEAGNLRRADTPRPSQAP